ncbi:MULTISPECIES: hypothetical protein [unclassified Leucobacter]|uniref:hypothetical protein n=1 Tax=unclassified Leucobacter TaxID=2621730 RepID=UPI000621D433|nr:hypothetical protein [Leucobacter sp. Ag1]KKI16895.1 hypothetical protein XM48_12875 [Leucobacter sp. Ag1]
MVVPYPRMPKNVVGRWLWIGLSSAIVLAFLALSVALIVSAIALSNPSNSADRPNGGELLLSIAMLLACLLGTALFTWILADGLRTITRERAEQRRLESSIRETRARIEQLRDRRR